MNDQYVEIGTLKLSSFLRALNAQLCCEKREPMHDDGFGPDDGIIYLGGGYWRACPCDRHGNRLDTWERSDLAGYYLINPSRTYKEIRTVTCAMNILIR